MNDEGIHYRANGELKALVGRDAVQLMHVWFQTMKSALPTYSDGEKA